MQEKMNFVPQLFVSVNLINLVPADKFYRWVRDAFDSCFLRKPTKNHSSLFIKMTQNVKTNLA